MINFTNLNIEGFCSIGNISLPLNHQHIIIIRARNGEGKSSLFSALVWCIYGKNLKGISDVTRWKKFRDKDYQGVKVELYWRKDNEIHKITRCQEYKGDVLGAKGANRLIYEIDANQVDEKSKPKLQALIEKNIGMSYSLFMNSIMFGQGMKRLIQESGADKKKLFDEIFDLSYLSKAKALAQDTYSGYKSEIYANESKLESLKGSLSDATYFLKDLKEKEQAWEEQVKKKLEALNKTKILRTKELKDYELEFSKLPDVTKDEAKLKDLMAKEEEKRNEAKKKAGISVEDLIRKLTSLMEAKKYGEVNKVLKSIGDSIIQIDESSQAIIKYHKSLDKIKNVKYQQQSLGSRIKSLKQSINDINVQIKNSQDKNDENIHDLKIHYKKRIREFKSKIEPLENDIEEKTEMANIYKWICDDPLGNNGIKAYIFESSMGMLNEVLESYSKVLGFRIVFGVDLSSARKDFTTNITKDGVDVFYEELSGGEKQLVSLAMAFAMNEVITGPKGINIAFLDEVFESLSDDNIEVVVELIKKIYKNRALFLITHQKSLPITSAKVLNVKKINGVSHYE